MRTFIWVVLSLLLFNDLYAKEVNPDQVKVAYVFNFLKHTNWRDEANFDQYTILVVSKNDNLKKMFLMLSSSKSLNNKKIKIIFYDGKNSPKNIQAVYVDDHSGLLYDKFFNNYEGDDVLLISDGYKEKQKVMINLFQNAQTVSFEINKANILNRALKVSPDLVLLGGSEIDVAKLYKSAQEEVKEQKTALDERQEKITSQHDLIIQQLDTIVIQQNELDNIYKNITIQKENLAQEVKNVQIKQREFDDAKKKLERLNVEIATQKATLVQKEGVITTQRGTIVALLFLFSIIVLLVSYVIKQNKRLNALSQTDPLTGLLNRRTLLEKIDNEIQKFNRYGTPSSILFIDVDHFKLVNDRYGHDKGDRVLKIIASLMNQHTRETDICVRWGGEEFIIFATNTDLENSIKLAENFRSIIENNDFNLGQKVTVSIGVATMQKSFNRDSFVKEADNALFVAKESGRNAVRY